MLRWPLLVLGFLSVDAYAKAAEKPILGGLGFVLSAKLPVENFGAALTAVPDSKIPQNRSITLPQYPPGSRYPWHHLIDPQMPRPLRNFPVESFAMLNDEGQLMRMLIRVSISSCDTEFEWLKKTLTKKYKVQGDPEVPPPPTYNRSLQITYSQKQIDVHCGPHLIMDYANYADIALWARSHTGDYLDYEREESNIAQSRVVLEFRRALRFADEFTMGDKYHIGGAFGVAFRKPFAKNSTQNFPIDQPFIVVLPKIPEEFSFGEVHLELAPSREPIVIRGKFERLSFETIAEAFKAKYGTPLKATHRHVIHNIGGNHAILKRLDSRFIEVAFLDTQAKEAQRKRLWERESEGL